MRRGRRRPFAGTLCARAEPDRAARRADGAAPARRRAGPGRLRRVVLPLAGGRACLHRGAVGGERQGRPGRRLPGQRDRRRAARRRLHHARGVRDPRTACRPTPRSSAFTAVADGRRCRCSGTSRRSATPTCSRRRRPSSAAGTPAAAAAASATAASPPRAGSRGPRPTRAGSCSTSTATPGRARPGSARTTLHRLDARLSDRFDPTLVGAPSGDLLEPGRARGRRPQRRVLGHRPRRRGLHRDARGRRRGRRSRQVVDGNGGRCREPFTTPVPCRLTASGSIALDTAGARRRRPSRAARGRRRDAARTPSPTARWRSRRATSRRAATRRSRARRRRSRCASAARAAAI